MWGTVPWLSLWESCHRRLNCTHKNGHGEGNLGRNALSVTFGDSSPKGRAKGGVPRHEEWRASPLPLPLGEVAERSEDGEGKLDCKALSVTFGDSSPRGRAKGALTTAKVLPSRAALFTSLLTSPEQSFSASHRDIRPLQWTRRIPASAWRSFAGRGCLSRLRCTWWI